MRGIEGKPWETGGFTPTSGRYEPPQAYFDS
jgi:hypothetical protein